MNFYSGQRSGAVSVSQCHERNQYQSKEEKSVLKLNMKIDGITVFNVKASANISSGYGTVSVDVSKEGYTAVCIGGYDFSSTYFIPATLGFNFETQKAIVTIRHLTNTSYAGPCPVSLWLVYVKN